MNLFVTGANGYIGSNFIKKASKLNFKIYALTRKKVNKNIKNVKWITGSIDKNWKEFKKSDVLVHLAAEGGYARFTSFNKCYDFNVLKSKKLVNNAIKSGCKKILIISSKKEKKIKSFKINKRLIKSYEKKPDYVYALSKAIFTRFCVNFSKKNNTKFRIIRLFHVYGKNEKKNKIMASFNIRS